MELKIPVSLCRFTAIRGKQKGITLTAQDLEWEDLEREDLLIFNTNNNITDSYH